MTRLALLLCLAAAPALAEPPPGSNPSGPLHQWYQSLVVPGTPNSQCCSIADCRNVVYRAAGDHLEAFIDSKTFPDDENQYHGHAPNAWIRVPDTAILKRHDNPTGEAVACWYDRQIRCFIEAAGT